MTLQSLAKQLSDYSEKLEEGTLSEDEVLRLTNLSREFYERMIVLRYKTVEESMHREEAQASLQEPADEKVAEPVSKTEPAESELVKTTDNQTVPEENLEEESPEAENQTKDDPEKENTENEISESEYTTEPEPENLEVAEEAPDFNVAPAVSPNQISLIDSIEEIKQMEKSLNDALKNEGPTLAQKLHQKPIPKLRSAFTINQKFQFISHLFDNDAEAFESSVARIDGCQTFLEADEYIQNNLKDHFDWEMNSPAAKEMMDMVERRFL